MENLERYVIDLKSILTETKEFHWQVDDEFFSAVQASEIQQGTLDVDLTLIPREGAFELVFRLKGIVKVPCNRCLELMEVPVETESTLWARWGNETRDDGDWIEVSSDEGLLQVAWNIYEIAALQIPLSHVHADGVCVQFDERGFWISSSNEKKQEDVVDPRWQELKKILKEQ